MRIWIKWYSKLQGRLVGEDVFGNQYYTEKKPKAGAKAKRWVVYKGLAEASKVPPEWHGWLHHTYNEPPVSPGVRPHFWVKSHTPNLTGTAMAYRPKGHILNPAPEAQKVVQDYEPWVPN